MQNVTFSNFTQSLSVTLGGARGRYSLRCDFPPFAQREFINRIEEEFTVDRIISEYDKQTATGRGTIYFQTPKTAAQVLDAVDYIFSTYIDSGL